MEATAAGRRAAGVPLAVHLCQVPVGCFLEERSLIIKHLILEMEITKLCQETVLTVTALEFADAGAPGFGAAKTAAWNSLPLPKASFIIVVETIASKRLSNVCVVLNSKVVSQILRSCVLFQEHV